MPREAEPHSTPPIPQRHQFRKPIQQTRLFKLPASFHKTYVIAHAWTRIRQHFLLNSLKAVAGNAYNPAAILPMAMTSLIHIDPIHQYKAGMYCQHLIPKICLATLMTTISALTHPREIPREAKIGVERMRTFHDYGMFCVASYLDIASLFRHN